MFPDSQPPAPFTAGDYIVAAIASNSVPVLVVRDQALADNIINRHRPAVRTEPLMAKTVDEAMAVLGVMGDRRRWPAPTPTDQYAPMTRSSPP